MKIAIVRLTTIVASAVLLSLLAASLLSPVRSVTHAEDQFDAAGMYKTKCVICHGQKAEKKFDDTLPDAQLVEIVLKGKKPEKPPNMPAYAEKGVTEDQAKALVEHMKGLKKAQ